MHSFPDTEESKESKLAVAHLCFVAFQDKKKDKQLCIFQSVWIPKKMANEIRFFELNTGAKIPSVGLGTWQAQADPRVVGDVIAHAIKVFILICDSIFPFGILLC